MHHRIDTILEHLRQDVARRISTPNPSAPLAATSGIAWRRCILDPVAIFHWFLIQVLHGNTSLEHVARLAGGLFTGAAYCLARAALAAGRLPIRPPRTWSRRLVPETHGEGLWRGHRTLLIDGSAFSMPDTPELQEQFGQPGDRRRDAASPWPRSWRCSMPGPGCSAGLGHAVSLPRDGRVGESIPR